MMMSSKHRFAAAAVASTLAAVLVATPAAAGSYTMVTDCGGTQFVNYAPTDYAVTFGSAQCTRQVRHTYYLNGSPGVFRRTVWYTGSTPQVPEIVRSEHEYQLNSFVYTRVVEV